VPVLVAGLGAATGGLGSAPVLVGVAGLVLGAVVALPADVVPASAPVDDVAIATA